MEATTIITFNEGTKQCIEERMSIMWETFRVDMNRILLELKEKISSSINGVSSNQGMQFSSCDSYFVDEPGSLRTHVSIFKAAPVAPPQTNTDRGRTLASANTITRGPLPDKGPTPATNSRKRNTRKP
ncbi:hypothetical protein Tco_0407710 [Tanacetum coccineum]